MVTAGSGGVYFSVGVDNNGTVIGGTGYSTLFGGVNSSIDFNSSLGGAAIYASGGNETLNAAASSAPVYFAAGNSSGNILMTAGSGADTFSAGAGNDTMTAGSGTDYFVFFKANTNGGSDIINDFNTTNDGVFLNGYSADGTFSSSAAGVTLTLSDSTQITFTNITDSSKIKINYGA
jgi:Ca2+-binding RTX toxin-like protein